MDEQTQGNSVNSTTSGKNGIVRALVALVLFVVYYYVMTMVGSLVAEATKLSPMYAIYDVRCAFALVAFVALGGRRYLRLDLRAIRNSVRLAWPIIALNLVLCLAVFGFRAYQQFAGVAEKPFDLTSLLGNAALLLALCAMFGIDEELGLRGLAFGGFLASLDDGSVDLVHQVGDEVGGEVVAPRLARRELHADLLAREAGAKRGIDRAQRLGVDDTREEHLWARAGVVGMVCRGDGPVGSGRWVHGDLAGVSLRDGSRRAGARSEASHQHALRSQAAQAEKRSAGHP